jgi:hypothetical protein
MSGNPSWRERIDTIDLLVSTSNIIYPFNKTCDLNDEVNSTSLPLQLMYPDLVQGNNPICYQTTQGGKLSDACCYCGHAIPRTIQ